MLVGDHEPHGHYQVAILGGGLAGSAAGTILARAGVRVCILERDTFPRDKLCGEFLSGDSAKQLEVLGCLEEVMRLEPPRMACMTFFAPDGGTAKIELPDGAFGISRLRLDHILLRNAEKFGAKVAEATEVRQVMQNHSAVISEVSRRDGASEQISADHVIACYGRQSHLDQKLQRRFVRKPGKYVGFKRHHTFTLDTRGREAMEALACSGEMYLVPGGYCGICKIEEGRVNVCMLLTQSILATLGKVSWQSLLNHLMRSNTAIAARLKGLIAPEHEQMLTVAQVPLENKELSRGRILFAGDAAGMIAPLCGDGQAMALESGVLLGQMLAANLGHPQAAADLWDVEWKSRFKRRMRLGRFMQPAIHTVQVANAGIRVLHYVPSLRRYLAAATRS